MTYTPDQWQEAIVGLANAGAGGTPADIVATGTLTAAQPTVGTPVAGGTVSVTLGDGQATVEAALTGTWNAGTAAIFEGTEDSGVTTNWFPMFGQDTGVSNPPNISSIAGGASKLIRIPSMGYAQVRIRANPFAGGDSVAVRLVASVAGSGMAGALSTNDGTFAKETGGNLATLVTNTADLLADGDHLATIDSGIASLVTNTADLLADGDQLATIQTNTANIPAKGAAATSASTPVNIASDQVVPVKRSAVAAYTLASTTTSGTTQNSGDITVGPYTEISLDINTTAQAGTNPTIQYFYERKGADNIYYVLWQSAVLTAATNTLSTSIGAGMNYAESLGATGRIRWVVGGSATPTYTHTINIQGK